MKVQAVLDEGAAGAHPRTSTRRSATLLAPFFLLTMKPTMYVANVDEHGFQDNPLLAAVEAHAASEGAPVVPVCAKLESEIADLDGEDKAGVPRRPRADGARPRPRDPRGLRAARAADVLHRGTEGSARVDDPSRRHGAAGRGRHPHRLRARLHPRGGDRATTISSRCKGEQGAKEAGKMRLEGKEYVVKDGDVMHFRFNV